MGMFSQNHQNIPQLSSHMDLKAFTKQFRTLGRLTIAAADRWLLNHDINDIELETLDETRRHTEKFTKYPKSTIRSTLEEFSCVVNGSAKVTGFIVSTILMVIWIFKQLRMLVVKIYEDIF